MEVTPGSLNTWSLSNRKQNWDWEMPLVKEDGSIANWRNKREKAVGRRTGTREKEKKYKSTCKLIGFYAVNIYWWNTIFPGVSQPYGVWCIRGTASVLMLSVEICSVQKNRNYSNSCAAYSLSLPSSKCQEEVRCSIQNPSNTCTWLRLQHLHTVGQAEPPTNVNLYLWHSAVARCPSSVIFHVCDVRENEDVCGKVTPLFAQVQLSQKMWAPSQNHSVQDLNSLSTYSLLHCSSLFAATGFPLLLISLICCLIHPTASLQ